MDDNYQLCMFHADNVLIHRTTSSTLCDSQCQWQSQSEATSLVQHIIIIHNTFILVNVNYCPFVFHFYDKSSPKKIEKAHERF